MRKLDDLGDYEGCKALLMDIIKRAADDWVLYRTSIKLNELAVANDAYVWLFKEGPGHPNWSRRIEAGMELWSFLSICETLGLDPEEVRRVVQARTPRDVRCSGRPAVNRHPKKSKTRCLRRR